MWCAYNPSAENGSFTVSATEAVGGQHSGLIAGKTDEYHGGWHQKIQVKPSTPYLFSFRIKLADEKGLQGRILDGEKYVDGQPAGRSAEEFSGSMDWTYEWVILMAPESDNNLVLFYPVLVTGQGKVWIDDVRLMELFGAQP